MKHTKEQLQFFCRGKRILGACWILVMAVSAALFLMGVYFAVSGKGQWMDAAAALIPFFVTGGIALFLEAPYKKGIQELSSKKQASEWSPATQRMIRTFSSTSPGKYRLLSVLLFFCMAILFLMGALFLWIGRVGGDLILYAAGAFLVALGFPCGAFGILDASHAANRRR